MTPSTSPLDVAMVFAVVGAAWVFPPAGLIVGALFFGLNWYLQERGKPSEPER